MCMLMHRTMDNVRGVGHNSIVVRLNQVSEVWGELQTDKQGKERTCLLTDLISALGSTPTKIFKTHHHYGLEGKAVIHALRVNQINCCTAEAHRCARGERKDRVDY